MTGAHLSTFQSGDGSQRTPDRLSGVGSGASALVAGWQVDRLHGYLTSYIEASVTAALALSLPPILRMALNDLCVHAAVFAPIFPSTGVRTETANPAAKSAPKLRNQNIECSAPCLPANGNR